MQISSHPLALRHSRQELPFRTTRQGSPYPSLTGKSRSSSTASQGNFPISAYTGHRISPVADTASTLTGCRQCRFPSFISHERQLSPFVTLLCHLIRGSSDKAQPTSCFLQNYPDKRGNNRAVQGAETTLSSPSSTLRAEQISWPPHPAISVC